MTWCQKIMTKIKKSLPALQMSTQREWEFHHKFISSKLARIKEHLIEQTKSPRGLTLVEKIHLDEVNFLIASGFDMQNEPIYVGKFDSVTRQKKSLERRDKHKSLTKAELLTKLAEAEVELEELRNYEIMEGKRIEFLLNYFDENREERVNATKARQNGKKTNPNSIHVRQMKAAREIVREIRDSKAHGTDLNGCLTESFEPTDFKVFCKKMRVACKPPPSATTLRNYFLKMTGLSTTK
jgi:hypothetical protein